LFTPLGLAVVFAMLASYGLSRTLTPITIGLLLKGEHRHTTDGAPRSVSSRLTAAFERNFERLRDGYAKLLAMLLRRRAIVPIVAIFIIGLGAVMFLSVGRDFFPLIDGGQIQLHVRAPAGTRIESTEAIFQVVEDKIREVIPEKERSLIVDNIGLPARAYNLAFADGSPPYPASSTRICSRKSTRRPSTPRSIGPVPRSLASMQALWPPTSMSA